MGAEADHRIRLCHRGGIRGIKGEEHGIVIGHQSSVRGEKLPEDGVME